jgi:hypothetical protein
MDDRTRQSACSHWVALDAAMTSLLPADQAALCRDGIRWGLADIASKYAKRLFDAGGDDARAVALETVGRELALALNAAWSSEEANRSWLGGAEQ